MKTFEYFYRARIEAKDIKDADKKISKAITLDMKKHKPSEIGYLVEQK